MKIAFIVGRFPILSEVFILNRITGLIDLGHDLQIYAVLNPRQVKVHSDIARYNLMQRVYYYMPYNKFIRIFKIIYLLIVNCHKIKSWLSKIKLEKLVAVFIKAKKNLFLQVLYLAIALLDNKFDIIHCNFGDNGIIGAYLKELGIEAKYVTSFYGYDISGFIQDRSKDVYENLFSNCDLCLSVNDYFKQRLIKLGCSQDKIIVHHTGVSLERFKFYEKSIQPGETINILTLGRLTEKKGHIYAINAIAKIIAQGKNILYTIAGDGPLRRELESLVSTLGISNFVKFLGLVEQKEVLALCEKAHIFLLVNVTAANGDQEGIPGALMEAQACGLPVISSYHSGISEGVLDGKSGFLVPEKDVDALVEKLKFLIENPQIWPKMGRTGRRFMEENFDIDKLNGELVQIYKRLLADEQKN